MEFIKKSNATIFLFLNAVLWGSSYIWSKMLLDYLPHFTILLLCSLGGLVSTFALFRKHLKNFQAKAFLPCILVSLISVLSNTFFIFSLQFTKGSNTAFIVQFSVVLTPMIMAVIDRKLPERKIMMSAVVALAGLFLLTCDLKTFEFNTGDLLALGNAFFFSLFLSGLKVISKRVEPVHFSVAHHTVNSIGFLTLGLIMGEGLFEPAGFSAAAIPLLAASIFVSAATVLIQSKAIEFVRPEKATLIYTFEPVTALMLGFAFLGERPDGLKASAGCLLILLSIIYSVYGTDMRKESNISAGKKLRVLFGLLQRARLQDMTQPVERTFVKRT